MSDSDSPKRRAQAGLASRELAVGTSLGNLKILECLGRGSAGAVYMALDTVLERVVAVKVLPDALSQGGPGRLAEFLRAANITQPLEDAGINMVFQAGRWQGLCYFVVEYAEERSAQDFVSAHGAMTAASVARLGVRVARALHVAHQRGLIHGHLRPSNVLLTPRGGVRVADFGLRAALEQAGYAPDDDPADFFCPELSHSQPQDARSDVYSLGAVLHYLATGVAPYPEATRGAVMAAHLRNPPPDARQVRSDVPDALVGVIQKAMAKSPTARYPDAAAMASDLEMVLERLAGDAEDTSAGPRRAGPPPLEPWHRRSRWLWPGLAGGAVAALVVVAVMFAWRADTTNTNDARQVAQQQNQLADKVIGNLVGNAQGLTLPGALSQTGGTDPTGWPAERVGGVVMPAGVVIQQNPQIDDILNDVELGGRRRVQPPPALPCPVSGHRGDKRWTLLVDGRVFEFCSEDCLRAFEREPTRYMTATRSGPRR